MTKVAYGALENGTIPLVFDITLHVSGGFDCMSLHSWISAFAASSTVSYLGSLVIVTVAGLILLLSHPGGAQNFIENASLYLVEYLVFLV